VESESLMKARKRNGQLRLSLPAYILMGGGGKTRGSPAVMPRVPRQIRHDPQQWRRGKAVATLMEAEVCGPTTDPPPGSTIGLGLLLA
jgi:hypothetical protein